ncbi:MAG: T9SS type A sorting domain-containing protein, partial [Elusimicrobiota bacterium]
DYAEAVTVDSEDNIIVTGYTDNGPDYYYFTIKYSSGLTTVKSSATYANAAGNNDQAHSVTVDSEDNIIITGYSNNGTNADFFTIKYDSDLVEISSVSYNGGDVDEAQAVTVDSENNIIVTGRRYDGTYDDFFTIKYDSDLVKISSASYDGGDDDVAYAVAVDSQDNIFAAGKSKNEDDDYLVIKYIASPEISAVSPSSGRQGESVDLTVTGINFYEGSEVNFSGSGISVNSSVVSGNNSIAANISIAENASLGLRDITVSNAPGSTALKTGVFEVKIAEGNMELTAGDVKVQGGDNGYVNPAIGEKAKIHFNPKDSGTVRVKIYTPRGQLVWKEKKRVSIGPDYMEWNCKNINSSSVSSGVYIIYITGPGIEKTKKVAVVK